MVLILLHFFGSSHLEYAPLIEQLSPKYRCLAPDLRGFGSSAPVFDNDYSVDAMTDDVLHVLKQYAPEPVVVIGHSMSGKVALNLASRQPEGLVGLVLLAPSPPSPEPIDEAERTRLLTTHGRRQAAVETARKITAAPLSHAYQEQIINDDLRSSPPAWSAWLQSGSREDISDRMERVILPIQLILGAEDNHITADLMQRTLLTHFPNARQESIPGAAHVLPLEKPVEVARIVDTFVHGLHPD